jgi:hypothetical protein
VPIPATGEQTCEQTSYQRLKFVQQVFSCPCGNSARRAAQGGKALSDMERSTFGNSPRPPRGRWCTATLIYSRSHRITSGPSRLTLAECSGVPQARLSKTSAALARAAAGSSGLPMIATSVATAFSVCWRASSLTCATSFGRPPGLPDLPFLKGRPAPGRWLSDLWLFMAVLSHHRLSHAMLAVRTSEGSDARAATPFSVTATRSLQATSARRVC